VWHADLQGPFAESKNGYKYIFGLKCVLSKWTVLIPIKDKHADTVAMEVIKMVFGIYGFPDFVYTDRGSEFVNDVFQSILKIARCEHIRTCPANPRANGLAENSNRTIKDALASFVAQDQMDWDIHLPIIQLAYNTTINVATGYSPYFLLHGREAKASSEEWLKQDLPKTVDKLANDLVKVLSWTWENEIEKQILLKEAVALKHNESIVDFPDYRPGEYVFYFRVPKRVFKNSARETEQKISAKLQPRYTGPYRVIKVISPVLYALDIHGRQVTGHAINMKPARRYQQVPKKRADGSGYAMVLGRRDFVYDLPLGKQVSELWNRNPVVEDLLDTEPAVIPTKPLSFREQVQQVLDHLVHRVVSDYYLVEDALIDRWLEEQALQEFPPYPGPAEFTLPLTETEVDNILDAADILDQRQSATV